MNSYTITEVEGTNIMGKSNSKDKPMRREGDEVIYRSQVIL